MDQEVQNSDTEVFGRCRCCLELGNVKDMWTPYPWDGANEIYGEMLIETFSITWDSSATNEVICEMCVGRLRDAHTFKREVLASEKLLMDGALDSESESVNEEKLSEMDQYEIITYHEEGEEDNDEIVFEQIEEDDVQIKQEEDEDIEYEEVEYLDDEVPEEHQKKEKKKRKAAAAKSSKKAKAVSIKQAPQSGRKRNYRMYTEATLRQCVEEAMSSTEPLSKVAARYGIPRKTLIARVYNIKHGLKPETPKEIATHMNNERHYQFVQEITKVLSLTDAVPFKVKSARYFCAFCYTASESFEDPSELRVHTASHGLKERLDRLDQIMRPPFLNEMLRVDIEMFNCTVCQTRIPTWNDMFVHLKDLHDIELDQVYDKLIPYKLSAHNIVYCALCNEDFPNVANLDSHMNAHYCNYVCSECGDTFVTENRLKHHIMIHNTGKFSCGHCGKTFSLEKYKKKHEAMVHKEAKLFKCADCGEAYHSEYERHLHIVEKHKERVRMSTCEFCGKTYDWKPYYMAHLRKVHHKVKNYKCNYCNKCFLSGHELKMHVQRHTGKGKHVCMFCEKNYVTFTELKKHMKKHAAEIMYVDEDSVVVSQS
ncbi:PR domain zinc finger protein 5-like isoform X2 [Ostrinia furnacalis]|uniref:PR domain zinc finger protein 5-like isoform X2 n=1 Tax=Ostrinia furnacalis TaxID=93504 RepID=UPI00103C36A2|nr:PR domain zinc finger protein 5-like isoform X2 [Ostrinia furnacalis]